MKAVVIGAGVSGLAAAHRILERDPGAEVVVLEASDRAGGGLRTERTSDGFLIERGPDSIITDKPQALAFARALGIGDEVVSTNPENRGAYVVCRGRLEPIPPGFSLMAPLNVGAFLRSPVMSVPGKLRAGLDLLLPRGGSPDESLASFVSRRFGPELLERLAQPLVGGIYGADPTILSLEATMPRFVDAEREQRSVTLGLRARQRKVKQAGVSEGTSGARYGLFISFQGGCGRLVERAAELLGERVRLKTPVQRVERIGEGVRVVTDKDAIDADAVVVAVPAKVAAPMLDDVDSTLTALMRDIVYGSAATVTVAYDRSDIPHAMKAYGFVVPAIERRIAMAATFASRKWPGRAPEGKELIRVFLGGSGRPEVPRWSDDELAVAARRELRELLGIKAAPLLTRVDRWVEIMPHYVVGHRALVDRIEARMETLGPIRLAGNSYRGVGIPDAIGRGQTMADAVVDLHAGRGATSSSAAVASTSR